MLTAPPAHKLHIHHVSFKKRARVFQVYFFPSAVSLQRLAIEIWRRLLKTAPRATLANWWKRTSLVLLTRLSPPLFPPPLFHSMKKRAPWKCPKSLLVQFFFLPIRHWPWFPNYWMILKEKKWKNKEFGRSSICANWVAAAASKSWMGENYRSVMLCMVYVNAVKNLTTEIRKKRFLIHCFSFLLLVLFISFLFNLD